MNEIKRLHSIREAEFHAREYGAMIIFGSQEDAKAVIDLLERSIPILQSWSACFYIVPSVKNEK